MDRLKAMIASNLHAKLQELGDMSQIVSALQDKHVEQQIEELVK